jgi:hypothetical protein
MARKVVGDATRQHMRQGIARIMFAARTARAPFTAYNRISRMPHYYFDIREDGHLSIDEWGSSFRTTRQRGTKLR